MTGEEHWFTRLLRVLSGLKLLFFVIMRMTNALMVTMNMLKQVMQHDNDFDDDYYCYLIMMMIEFPNRPLQIKSFRSSVFLQLLMIFLQPRKNYLL